MEDRPNRTLQVPCPLCLHQVWLRQVRPLKSDGPSWLQYAGDCHRCRRRMLLVSAPKLRKRAA